MHVKKLKNITSTHKYKGRSFNFASQSSTRQNSIAFQKAGIKQSAEKEIQIKKENAKLLENILKISDRKNRVTVYTVQS